MTSPTSARRVPVWAWVLLAIALIAAAIAAVVAAATATVGAGAAGTVAGAESATERDKALTVADPNGAKACDLLGMHLVGLGTSFNSALEAARTATTTAIRDATTPDTMREACVAAGANMGEQ